MTFKNKYCSNNLLDDSYIMHKGLLKELINNKDLIINSALSYINKDEKSGYIYLEYTYRNVYILDLFYTNKDGKYIIGDCIKVSEKQYLSDSPMLENGIW